MAPLIGFIILVIDLYIWVVIASAILSWLVAFNVVNMNNRFVLSIADMLYRLTEPTLRPIRNILPNLGGIDISPVILILLLLFVRDVVLLGWLAPAVSLQLERGRGQASCAVFAPQPRGRDYSRAADTKIPASRFMAANAC